MNLTSAQVDAMQSVRDLVEEIDPMGRKWTTGRTNCVVYGRLPDAASFKVRIGKTRTRVLVWIDQGPGCDEYNKSLFDDLAEHRDVLEDQLIKLAPSADELLWDRKDDTARAAAVELSVDIGVGDLADPECAEHLAHLVLAMHDTFDEGLRAALADENPSFSVSVEDIESLLIEARDDLAEVDDLDDGRGARVQHFVELALKALSGASGPADAVPVPAPSPTSPGSGVIQCPACAERHALRVLGADAAEPGSLLCERCGSVFGAQG